jgi:hypothetical protein
MHADICDNKNICLVHMKTRGTKRDLLWHPPEIKVSLEHTPWTSLIYFFGAYNILHGAQGLYIVLQVPLRK